MSVDINWERLTTGPDGIALAEKIRSFVNERFQTVTLPRFIKQVSVHAFEFGSTAPQIEIKDICDPLPDFYEENDGDQDGEDEVEEGLGWQPASATATADGRPGGATQRQDNIRRSDGPSDAAQPSFESSYSKEPSLGSLHSKEPSMHIDTRPGLRSLQSLQSSGSLGSPFSSASTSGISGGTSNLNYFHTHLATGLSGTQTPLAAVAGAHLPKGVWPDYSSLTSNYRSSGPGHRHSASGSYPRNSPLVLRCRRRRAHPAVPTPPLPRAPCRRSPNRLSSPLFRRRKAFLNSRDPARLSYALLRRDPGQAQHYRSVV
jgi:distribution and morphology protein 12